MTSLIILFCCNFQSTLSYYFIGNQNLRRRKKIIGQDPAELPVEDKPSNGSGYFSALVLPFILHLGFMAATAFFIMHVQVCLLSKICTFFKRICTWCVLKNIIFLLSIISATSQHYCLHYKSSFNIYITDF